VRRSLGTASLAVVLAAGCGRLGFGVGADSGAGGDRDVADAADDADVHGADAGIAANVVFVTSTSHAPETLTSLAVADAICAARATEAGLPGTHVAWISRDGVAARDRLAGARGWVRVDGAPFTDQVDDLLAGTIWMPLRLDERGNDVGDGALVYTGTTSAGTLATGDNCSVAGTGRSGSPHKTFSDWTSDGSLACNVAQRLYCFGVDRVAQVAPTPAAGRRAFITSASFAPSSGSGAADALCASSSSSSGLSGSYLALIGGPTASAMSRFDLGGANWVRLDGIPIATSTTTFAAAQWSTPLNVTAAMTYVGDHVATGGGLPTQAPDASATCDDWSNAAVSFRSGRARNSAIAGFDSTTRACGTAVAVYCLEL
jgi:hypothetical protein